MVIFPLCEQSKICIYSRFCLDFNIVYNMEMRIEEFQAQVKCSQVVHDIPRIKYFNLILRLNIKIPVFYNVVNNYTFINGLKLSEKLQYFCFLFYSDQDQIQLNSFVLCLLQTYLVYWKVRWFSLWSKIKDIERYHISSIFWFRSRMLLYF